MSNSGEQTPFSATQPPAPRRRGRKLFLLGGIVFVLLLTLAIGMFLVPTSGSGQALAARPNAADAALRPTLLPMTPIMSMEPSQCGGQLTVTAVRNRTITVTGQDGNTVTIYTTGQTHYTQYGHPVSATAVRVGSNIYVVGTCNGHGGAINATSIEIVS